MKVALELDFVHLAKTFSQADDPVEFYDFAEDYGSQLTTLDDMGYDVNKLWGKFYELRSIAVDGADNRENKGELEAKMRDLQGKTQITKNRMTELRKEMEQLELEAASKMKEEQAQNLESKIRKCTLKEKENFVNFKTAATKPWFQ